MTNQHENLETLSIASAQRRMILRRIGALAVLALVLAQLGCSSLEPLRARLSGGPPSAAALEGLPAATTETDICVRDPARPGCDAPHQSGTGEAGQRNAQESSSRSGASVLGAIGGALKGALVGAGAGIAYCPVVFLPLCAGAIAVSTAVGAVGGAGHALRRSGTQTPVEPSATPQGTQVPGGGILDQERVR